jgi:hypothetical protein
MANVFVSHREADMPQAARLAEELRRLGHHVWLDQDEIALGDSIVARVEEGLSGASFVVLCYSDAGVTSPWMSREWMSALARQLNKADVRILPVRLTGAAAPAILADIKYADLMKNWDSGITQLAAALG